MANAEGMKKRVIRYIVTSLHRIHASILPLRKTPRATRFNASTLQRFNVLTRRSLCSRAFTVIELIVVLGLIIVLTGLVLSTVGYARKKSARVRAETEIAAMSAACENYKSDNSVYPTDPSTTEQLDPTANGNPNNAAYSQASFYLYTKLSGDSTGNRNPTGKSYMAFKPNMLLPAGGTGTVTAIADPFGFSYGYSTRMAAMGSGGYNPTFDLWSTAGLTNSPPTAADQNQWMKNW